MKRGRKPKPTAVKAAAGNPGKRPLNKAEPAPSSSLAIAPSWLPAQVAAVWDEMAPPVAALGLLTDMDRATFARGCVAEETMRASLLFLYGQLPMTHPLTRRFQELGMRQAFMVLKESRMEATRIFDRFGMNPSERSRVMAPQKPGGRQEREALATKPIPKPTFTVVNGGQA